MSDHTAAARALLRMQDPSGRGPWRPGFSAKWLDGVRDFSLPAVQQDFGVDWKPMIEAAFRRGLHIGVAVRGEEKFHQWFTPTERVKLAMLGFRIVDASGCEVLGETDWQVVIGSPDPLADLPLVNRVSA